MGTIVSPEAQLPYPYLNYCPEELQYQEMVDIVF
jgi:hypothetical protein